MTILSGGAYQRGAIRLVDYRQAPPGMFGAGRTHQITSPLAGVDNLSQWLRLVACPLGLDRRVLRARIAQQDYVNVPTRSGKGAEANSRSTDVLYEWGKERLHYWRMLVDPHWRTYPGETGSIVAQVKEVGTTDIGSHPANLYFELDNGNFNLNRASTAVPAGATVFSMPFKPGQELDFSVRCRWRDGIHADGGWDRGYLGLTVNGTLVWEESNTVNGWIDAADTTQPFQVAGLYMSNENATWWAGRTRSVFHIGQALGDAEETHASLRAFVDAQLR